MQNAAKYEKLSKNGSLVWSKEYANDSKTGTYTTRAYVNKDGIMKVQQRFFNNLTGKDRVLWTRGTADAKEFIAEVEKALAD